MYRPLPTAPKIRAEILAGIESGMADVHAGRGVDFDDLLAEWDAKLAGSPAGAGLEEQAKRWS